MVRPPCNRCWQADSVGAGVSPAPFFSPNHMRAEPKHVAGWEGLAAGYFCFRLLQVRILSAVACLYGLPRHGFQDWVGTRNYANTSPSTPEQVGAVTMSSGWQGLQIYHPDLNSGLYTDISLWLIRRQPVAGKGSGSMACSMSHYQ